MTVSIPTYPDLAGKVAVVTGGSKGIGAATCVGSLRSALERALVLGVTVLSRMNVSRPMPFSS